MVAKEWRVAVVEDHLLQRRRTIELIEEQPDCTVVFDGETMPEFLEWLRQQPQHWWPHLIILDLLVERGPSADPDAVEKLISAGFRVLVLSAMASPTLVQDMLRAGVGGIVGKRDSEAQIIEAVRAVLARRAWMTPELASVIAGDADRPKLSPQEERALVLYASGLTLNAVAEVLGVQPGTAKQYLDRVKEKYAQAGRSVRTKLDLGIAARADGYLDEE